MHAIAARKHTRQAQIAAGILIAAAGALALLPIGAARGDGEPTTLTLKPPTPKVRIADPLPNADEVSQALNNVAPPVPRVESPKPTDVAGTGDKGGPAAQPTPAPAPWRYIGSITNASYRRAIVVHQDKQQLLAEGDKVDSATIVQITPEYLLVRDAQGERQVPLAPKVTPVMQIVTAGTGGPGAGVQNDPGRPLTKNPSGMSPEEEAKYREVKRMQDEAAGRIPKQGARSPQPQPSPGGSAPGSNPGGVDSHQLQQAREQGEPSKDE